MGARPSLAIKKAMSELSWKCTIVVVSLVAVWLAVSTDAQQQVGTGNDVTLITFNTGLTPFGAGLFSTYSVRRPAILEALRSNEVFTTADVVCLQELAAQDDHLAARASLTQAGLGYHYSFYDHFLQRFSTDSPACNAQDLAAAFTCAAATPACRAAVAFGPQVRFLCLISQCQDLFLRLSQSCISCISEFRVPPDQLGNDTLIIQRCGTMATERQYVPSFGIHLSSRVPLANVRYTPILMGGTQTVVRGFIQGTHPTIGEVSCTHQTTVGLGSAGFPAPDGFPSYDAIILNETEQVTRSIGSQQGVLLGDQNASPAIPAVGVVADAPAAYQAYLDAGFRSALLLANNATCTFCRTSNPLESGTRDQILDHVFVSSQLRDSVISAETVLRENISGRAYPLSDHYAVRAVVNTGDAHSVALSRWARSFEQWSAAFERWQAATNNGQVCTPPPSM